jgi:apolipoprotein D and lipocalin family protein
VLLKWSKRSRGAASGRRRDVGQCYLRRQFIWPIKAEYLICYLDPDYRTVIVGRSKRDYVWIMARAPAVPEPVYRNLVERVVALGYDVDKLRKVPQRWPES